MCYNIHYECIRRLQAGPSRTCGGYFIYTEVFTLSRRKDREQAFSLVFQKTFTDYDISEISELALLSRDDEPNENAEKSAQGVFEHIDDIDAAIKRHLKGGWTIQRISKVAISIMRLTVYELKFVDELDAAVSLNEAVNLAKKYATPEDASFINGVLNAVAKEDK